MSAPHNEPGVEPVPGVGRSVNSGIDISLFPSKMSSIEEIARILEHVGCPAIMTKIDWSGRVIHDNLFLSFGADAYKHCVIRATDRCLQVLKFGDRYIIEVNQLFVN